MHLGAEMMKKKQLHAYDLAAWAQLSTYTEELKEMECQSKEEYIGSLRRKSSGFSRGVSKYRGVARHHHNGRWEARIGRVFGNKYLYLGTYATQEEAATAYDMAAIEYRGLNAVTNFDLSRYIKWLRPNHTTNPNPNNPNATANSIASPSHQVDPTQNPDQDLGFTILHHQNAVTQPRNGGGGAASSALGLLLQSSKFKEMLQRTSVDCPATPPESDPPRCDFPDDIQTFFECHDSGSYGDGFEEADVMFADLNQGSCLESFDSFAAPVFNCGLNL